MRCASTASTARTRSVSVLRTAEIGAQVQAIVRASDQRPLAVEEVLQTQVAEFVTTGSACPHVAGELPSTLQLSGGACRAASHATMPSPAARRWIPTSRCVV